VVKPWVGAGIGYEWLSLTSKAGGVEATSSLRGLEAFNLQAGLQLSLLPVLSLGPYVQYQRGTYSHAKVETPLFKSDGDIEPPRRALVLVQRVEAHAASCSRKIFELCRMSTGNPG
jgi:hypothetical protein